MLYMYNALVELHKHDFESQGDKGCRKHLLHVHRLQERTRDHCSATAAMIHTGTMQLLCYTLYACLLQPTYVGPLG